MRHPSLRATTRAALALLFAACTADRLGGPTAPHAIAHDLASGGGALVINEVMANPSGTEPTNEWFEIYNAGAVTVNLSGWKVFSRVGTGTNTESYTVAADFLVPPGAYAVIARDTSTANLGEDATLKTPYGVAQLANNNSDWLELRDPSGAIVDHVDWGSPGPTTDGVSRELINPALDNSVMTGPGAGANWQNGTQPFGARGDRGSPGRENPIPGPVVAVTVRISFVTPGTSFTITASGVDAKGQPSPTTFTWSSTTPAIATIDPVTGRATGKSVGVATITATAANGVSASAPLFVVNPGDVASVSVNVGDGDLPQMPAGFTKPLFTTVRTTDGVTLAPALAFTTSDATVATVDALGYVTGVAPGKATIRATTPNGVYNVITFTVDAADAPTSAVYRGNLEFGQPADATPDDDVLLLGRAQFALSFNPARGGPNWVSWELNATQFGSTDRCNCFSADPSLPAGVYHVVDFDYRNGGYDRGHMVQSASRATTAQENARTFLLTNILPQAAANNQGPWSQLENALNDSARAGREVYVVAGGIYRPGAPTLKGEGKVAIPDYTWKVAVIMAGGKGLADVHSPADLNVIAVRMPNLTEAHASAGAANFAGTTGATGNIRNTPWQTYRTTVDEIEQQTGYDVLARLPDNIERLVESNDRAPVANAGGPYAGLEGSAVRLDASASSDPDGDALTYAWDFGDGSTGTGATPAHVYRDNGSYTATVTVSDPTGVEATATAQVTVANVAPTITQLSTPVAPIALGQPAGITLSIADPGDDEFTTAVDWDDAQAASAPASCAGGTPGATTLTHQYAQPGVYTIRVTVCDDDGGVVSRMGEQYIVVFDPSAGFATGGGWIASPAGAYAFDRALAGKASFGFVARYAPGAQTPSGNTEFQFHEGSLDFHSTSYDWLVVNPSEAQYKGSGTIKGRTGSYGFFLTAIDGEQRGGQPDRFRIKITDAQGTVVYDNVLGADEDSDASTALGGGNVSVKTR